MRFLHFSFLLLILAAGCRKEIVSDNSDKRFPLFLSSITDGQTTYFNWEEANVTEFEKYVLVRSANEISPGGTPSAAGNTIIFESTDVKTTSVTDDGIFFDPVGHYKLYTQINGRWLESNELTVDNRAVVIQGSYFSSCFLPDSSWVLVLSSDPITGQGKLSLIDYGKGQLYESSSTVSLFSPDQIGFTVTYTNNQPEVWLWSFNGYLQASLPELTTIRSSTLSSTTQYSFAGGGSSVVMTTQNSISSSFNVRKKSNLSILKSYTRQNYFDHRTLLMLDTTANRLAEIGATKIDVFSLNAATGVITPSSQVSVNTLGFTPFLVDVPVSYNRAYFCPHQDDIIYDTNLNIVLRDFLPVGDALLDLTFSKDGQFVYALTNNFNGAFSTQVHKFSFPDGQLIKTLKVNVPTNRIMRTDDGIAFVVSNGTQTSAKKIVF